MESFRKQSALIPPMRMVKFYRESVLFYPVVRQAKSSVINQHTTESFKIVPGRSYVDSAGLTIREVKYSDFPLCMSYQRL